MNIKQITEENWLGKDNELGIDIFRKKYPAEGEAVEEWLDRIANGNHELRELILEKKFLFGGRILSNRGRQYKSRNRRRQYDSRKISLSNCYVIQPPEDNIESIFECAKELARTFSYGGGCGIDIGKLRPRNAEVHNAAEQSTGAVSFIQTYSDITGTISQNGRRKIVKYISLEIC